MGVVWIKEFRKKKNKKQTNGRIYWVTHFFFPKMHKPTYLQNNKHTNR